MRSERIHHRERIKKKRSNYWGGVVARSRQPGIVIDTPKPCSCYMCGNPRHHFKELSIQERRMDQGLI